MENELLLLLIMRGHTYTSITYFKLAEITNGNELEKSSNMGKTQSKCDQTSAWIEGYKWSQKSPIFDKVKIKV